MMVAPARVPHPRGTRTAVNYAVTGLLATFFLISLLLLASRVSRITLLDEIGYGDSYVLYDVLHFQRTGVIYRDLSEPPYVPALYSPMVYVLYSLPGAIPTAGNVFLGPRLIALSAFLLCVLVVVSIVRALISERFAWIWGALLACSIANMWNWVLQLRGDFPGIFFNLLAIRLLISRGRWAAPLAGLCAGFALHFKIVFVAALVAGGLWLLVRRQWKQALAFSAAALLSSAGLYLLFSAREPRMFAQIFALTKIVPDVRGWLRAIYQTAKERTVSFALLGIIPLLSRACWRWALLILFAATSFVFAALTVIQAGGNINYFFETFFALVPLAVLGIFEFASLARRRFVLGAFLMALFAFYYVVPRAQKMYVTVRAETCPDSVNVCNQQFRLIEQALRGQHILSTVPRLSLLDPEPALVEPFLLSVMEHLGRAYAEPLLDRIHRAEFDAVITGGQSDSIRGVPVIAPDVHSSIAESYTPHCLVFGRWLIHLPRKPHPRGDALKLRLTDIGCEPVAAHQTGTTLKW